MARRAGKKFRGTPAASKETGGVLTTDLALADGKLLWLQALLIVCAGWWVSAPALLGGWIRDDSFYLTASLFDEPGKLWAIWFQPGSFIEYYPITETVQWLQWLFWGNATFGYHLTNVLLHLINALLVWRLLAKLGVKPAWLGGLIFAVHPAQVESVAWISELKNTLSLVPFLLAMMAWIDYEEHRRARDYQISLGLFLVAMLCKISMAPFPAVILLYAWWKRGRIDGRDLKACAPFLAISLLLGAVTVLSGIWFGKNQFIPSLPEAPLDLLSRSALTGSTLSFYFAKVFWPGRLLPLYPQWSINPLTLVEFVPWLLLAGALVFCWSKRRTWGRHALLGTGFFLVNLLPFSGLITVSYMKFTWVMDHLLYFPMIGLIGLTVAAIGDLETRLALSVRPLIRGLVTILVTLLAFQAHAYSGIYINSLTLWAYTLEYNPDSWCARAAYGNALVEAGKYPEAIQQCEMALALRPHDPDMHYALALALAKSGQLPEAVVEFKQVLSLNPNNPNAYNNLGFTLVQMGQIPEALHQYEMAMALRPNDYEIHYNRAIALIRSGQMPAAQAELEQVLKIRPDYTNAHINLAFVLGQTGQIPKAIEQLEMAQQLAPDNLNIQNQLARLEELQKNGPATSTIPPSR